VLILTELEDITGVVELMFSRITEHLLIALVGIITPHGGITTLIQDKRDIPVHTVLTILTDHTVGGSIIHTFYLKGKGKKNARGSKKLNSYNRQECFC
jgi:hypothetical protein